MRCVCHGAFTRDQPCEVIEQKHSEEAQARESLDVEPNRVRILSELHRPDSIVVVHLNQFFGVGEIDADLSLIAWLACIQRACRALEQSPIFQGVVALATGGIAIVEVCETNDLGEGEDRSAFQLVFLLALTADLLVKVLAKGKYPLRYFRDGWNRFDCFIIMASFIEFMPGMAAVSSRRETAFFLHLRLLRFVRAFAMFPRLHLVSLPC